MTAEVEPKNVTEALARIMGEIGGIGKTHSAAAQQGGYKYRGIEDVTERLQRLLAKYGVVAYPRGRITEIREIVVNGKPWTDTVVSYRYKIVHGPSGTWEMAELPGIGRDNADKGANKGATQAFKYLWLETLCISDPKDDNDGTHEEAERRGRTQPAKESEPTSARSAEPEDASEKAPNETSSGSASVEDMSLQDLTKALDAAGLSLAGSSAAKRQRLAEHLAAPAVVGANGAGTYPSEDEEPFA